MATADHARSLPRLDPDHVRDELRIEDVADHYGLGDPGHDVRRVPTCPYCGAKSTGVTIDTRSQRWGHFGHGKREGGRCYGDALDLIAACEQLDRHRDFDRVLTLGATIAGVEARDLTPEEREARRIERERRNAERLKQLEADRVKRYRDAKFRAAQDWHTMIRGRWNAAGMRYLRSRRLDPGPLIEGDYVRFDAYGNVAVPLYGFDGDLINVVRRTINGTEPKTPGLKECPTEGTLSGRIQEITAASTIVCEGVIDTLTAVQRWPGRTVLGAHGAGNMEAVTAAAAPRVLAAGGKLVIVADDDETGQRAALLAGKAALRAGLVMDETLLLVDLGGHKDLNEAHCKGWRP
jgi:hypothetical protein